MSADVGDLEMKIEWRSKLPGKVLWSNVVVENKLIQWQRKSKDENTLGYFDLASREHVSTELVQNKRREMLFFGKYICFSTGPENDQGLTVVDMNSMKSKHLTPMWTYHGRMFYDAQAQIVYGSRGTLKLEPRLEVVPHGLSLAGNVYNGKHYGWIQFSYGNNFFGCFDLDKMETEWELEGLSRVAGDDKGNLYAMISRGKKDGSIVKISPRGELSDWEVKLPCHSASALLIVDGKLLVFHDTDTHIIDLDSAEIVHNLSRYSFISNLLINNSGKLFWESPYNELTVFDVENFQYTRMQLTKASYSNLAAWEGKILRRAGTKLQCIV